MRKNYVKLPLLIAALYFGGDLHAQSTQDTVTKENKIEEVVVIGYGTQKKENVTGSIGVITAKDLADRPNSNPLSSVQGKASGVQIFNSGTPGSSPRVDIRGISSMTGKTVYIVDGSITTDISYLNSQDIESMSILKDPSSLAIYGAQASNGAVIIKTKSGKGKKPTFNVNSYMGIKTVTNIPKMVNGDQYIELYNERLKNDNNGSTEGSITKAQYPGNFDWFKEILKSSSINSNDFSASGVTGKLSYYGSVGYIEDVGNLAAGRGINSGSNFKRLTTKANLSYKITDNITIGDNFTFSKMLSNISNNPLLNAYAIPPVYTPFDPTTGNYTYSTLVNVSNPKAQLDLYRSQNRQERLLNNVWVEVKFLKDFTFRSSLTHDNLNSNKYEYTPVQYYVPPANQVASSLITRDSKNRDYVWDTTLNWKKAFGNHNLEILAGYSQTQNYYNIIYRSANNVNYDGTNESLQIGNGTNIFEVGYYDAVRDVVPRLSRIQSFFGRINYDYQGKYLINGSVRRDGSSNFSESRNEIFPAVSAGWVISKEGFMSEQNIFSFFKLRGSWGRLGNPDVQNGAYNLYASIINGGAYYGNTGSPAATIDQIVDNSISWEITTGKDFGVEMAFLNNNLKLEATYFDKDTKDVVYGVVQGTVSGAGNWASYVTNAFSFNNKGFELSLNYDKKLSEKVRIGFYGNFTSLKNEITSVFGGSYANAGASLFGNSIIRLQAGQAVGSYYGYDVAGVFQTDAEAAASGQTGAKAGWFKFTDRDGNGIIDERDKTFLGSPVPKGTYGFGFNMNVSNFDFAIDFQGVFGNKIYNYNREQRYGNESWDLDFYNNRWHGAGTSNSYSMVTNNQSVILPSSFYVEDGAYFRIRNIQVGYTLPKGFSNMPNFTRVRLYLSAQNPWTTFKYNGFSPEINNTDRVQMGIDNNIYPLSAIYTLGANITF